MQPRDLFRRRRPGSDSTPPTEPTTSGAPDSPFEPVDADAATAGQADEPGTTIRKRQRLRRDAARQRLDISAFLGTTAELADPGLDPELEPFDQDDEDDEERDGPPAPPITGQVWIVFRAVSWSDAEATLRESDTLVGVYSSEAGAKAAVSVLDRDTTGAAEHWYQPYKVTE
jgi:hypothetical protein